MVSTRPRRRLPSTTLLLWLTAFVVAGMINQLSSVQALSTVTLGIDGKQPPVAGNWRQRRYKTLHVVTGTEVVFNWIGSWNGLQLAKTKKDWRMCRSGGGELLHQPALGGSYTLDTTSIEPGTSLYVFCPVHCDADSRSQMKVRIKVMRRRPCRQAENPRTCAKRPGCTWVGAKCRPLVIF